MASTVIAHDATTTEPLPSNRAHIGPVLISKQREWSLSEGPILVGRDRDCAVSIDSPGVSRRHARINVTSSAATIEDLGSKNGTFVNDRRVEETTTLDDGNQIRVGPVSMLYRRMGALPSTVTQRQRKV